MKIISWNIGNFIFVKNPLGRENYSFYIPDLEEVVNLIKSQNADTVFLQEIHTDKDAEIIFARFPEFTYKTIVHNDSRYSKSILMSKYNIEEKHTTESDDYIINGITLHPIHLNAFSPKKRQSKVIQMIRDLEDKKTIILGDTNLWIYKKIFISNTDKVTYKMLTKDHVDILSGLGSTCRFFLSIDKIFITEDLNCINAQIVKHRIGFIDHYLISCEIETD